MLLAEGPAERSTVLRINSNSSKLKMQNLKLQLKKSGFTLIELLITMSIIAILITLGLINYQVIVKNSRNAKRQADFKTIQSALEQYHGDQFVYPLKGSGICPNGQLTFGCPLTTVSGNRIYLNLIPTDPLASNNRYCYKGVPEGCDNDLIKCTSYALYASLENPPPSSPQFDCDERSYNYKVIPP